MNRIVTLVAVLALTLTAFIANVALADDAPPGPVVLQQATFVAADAPAPPFTAVQQVVDFVPGARVRPHTHGGPAYILMITGELILHSDDGQRTLRAGDTALEHPGHVYWGGNYTDTPVRLMVVYLVPAGIAVTTFVDRGAVVEADAPGPTIVHVGELAFTEALDQMAILHLYLTYPPGMHTPWHVHGGPAIASVLEGSFTIRHANGTETVYPAGSTRLVEPHVVHQDINRSDAPTLLASTLFLPVGAAGTTVVNSPFSGVRSCGATFAPSSIRALLIAAGVCT